MRALSGNIAPQVGGVSLAPARKVVIVGSEAWRSGINFSARLACGNQIVWYLCADNRFDPYAIARLAKTVGASPTEALERIYIARAFTAYQLTELIARLDPQRIYGPVIISGLC